MGAFDGALGHLQFAKSSRVTNALLILSSCVFATTSGYDSALINGLNIMSTFTSDISFTPVLKSLNTSAAFIGWGIVSFFMGPVVDRVGRRTGVLISICLKLTGVVLMTAAQSTVMFVVGRAVLGAGAATSSIAASTWLGETLPARYRATGLGFIYAVYYAGAFIAAGVTLGTSSMAGSWSWRLPTLLQAVWSLLCFVMLLFVPESPRWLISRDRREDALTSLASTHSNGNKSDPMTLAAYKEIMDTLEWERSTGKRKTYAEVFKTPNSRRRIMLVISAAVIGQCSGNNIVTFYLGTMLTNAGITNKVEQLKINLVLSAFCFVCAMTGTVLVHKIGRKTMCLASCSLMTIFLYLVAGLTKDFSGSSNLSGLYGTVAAIFLFQGSYAVGQTPLTILYPPEILNFSIRANGMAAWTMTVTLAGMLTVFAWPLAVTAIGWKAYMINATYDVFQVVFVALFWVETKDKTLEEIDAIFDGEKHSDVPDLEDIRTGKATLKGVEGFEVELEERRV